MNIEIENIGIIRLANVKCDGLTVITGKNNAGKTTVGRVLYSLINASANASQELENSKRTYLINNLFKISNQIASLVQIRGAEDFFSDSSKEPFENLTQYSDTQLLADMLRIRRLSSSVSTVSLLAIIERVKEMFERLDYSEYRKLIKELIYPSKNELLFSTASSTSSTYSYFKNEIIAVCDETITTIQTNDNEISFIQAKIKYSMMQEFRNQIKPVSHPELQAKVRISENDRIVEAFTISDRFEFDDQCSYNLSLNRSIFIDNPFILEYISPYRLFDINIHYQDANSFYSNTQSHEKALIKMLRKPLETNYFQEMSTIDRFSSVKKKLEEIIPGEFKWISDEFYYAIDHTNLHIDNLATGSKQFSILKILLNNGYLDKNTILILDEPESHLHPEWINLYAELIVLLVKEIDLRVLLTTHSANLLLALEVNSKKHDVWKMSHMYMAESKIDGIYMKEITDSAEAYAHLSVPFLEMNLEKEYLDED